MEGMRLFIVGNTLFAENVAQMLLVCGMIEQIERFEALSDAILPIENSPPDVLILADVDTDNFQGDIPFLPICPDIPVICIDHQSTFMKLITTRLVNARLHDLVKSITDVKRITL